VEASDHRNPCHFDSNSNRHSCSLRIMQASNAHEAAQIFDMESLCSVYVPDILLHGPMQSAPFHNDLFVVWAMLLVIFLGNANSISAYNLEGNENRKSYNFVVLVQCLCMQFLIFTYSKETIQFQTELNILNSLSVLRIGERVKALTLASRSYGLVRSSKLVADFMIYKHTLSNEEKVDPTCMKGYNYLVNDEKGNVKFVPPLPKIVVYYR
jgi:hypothetical protein